MPRFLRHRPGNVAALAMTLLLGGGSVVAIPPAAGAGQPSPVPPTRTGTEVRTVTLITGDQVMLPGGGGAAAVFVPGTGRRHIGALRQRTPDGHLHVIPRDATRLVASGKLDRRLFDVTRLVDDRYDDAHSSTIPLILTGPKAARTPTGISVNRMSKASATGSWKALAADPGVEKVWLDAKLRPVLDRSVPQIGAPAAWQAGYTGRGVKVAVLDSGIDTDHPDLRGKVTAARNFTTDPVGDAIGHGTHVAATIAGIGNPYRGVAPDAELIDGKVCGETDCSTSSIIAGMHWAVVEQGADVVNVSLGGGDDPGTDPIEEAVDTLSAETGALFVVAAGNSGPGSHSITSPGSATSALTVGAVDQQDRIAEFSGRGPRAGDGAVKPDVTAPGVNIAAAQAKGTQLGSAVDLNHVRASGTSMATPHVAGAAALLAQQHPTRSGAELKALLMASTQRSSELSAYDQGAGRVELRKAITQSVVSEPASVAFGKALWPHHDDAPITKTIGYRNLGNTPVELTLRGEMTGPALTLSTTRLTVPAGGSASATVTIDTRLGSDGAHSGWVFAEAAGLPTVATPVGVEKEMESRQLTLRPLDRAGRPTSKADLIAMNLSTGLVEFVFPENGAGSLRLPAGRYLTFALVYADDIQTRYAVALPNVELNQDRTVELDARLAEPVSVTVERPTARMMETSMEVVLDLGDNWAGFGFLDTTFEGLHTAQAGADEPIHGVTTLLASQWADPGPDGTFENSPVSYHLMNTLPNRFFTGWHRSVRDSELARVTARHSAGQTPQRHGSKTMFGLPSGGDGFGLGSPLVAALPNTTTHLVEGAGTQWLEFFDELENGSPVATLVHVPFHSFEAGKQYADRWNAAVFGPAPVSGGAIRFEDTLFFNLSMYSDQAGHAGTSAGVRASTRLFRNGTLLTESRLPGFAWVKVPDGRAAYRLQVDADRAGLSASQKATWKFTYDPSDPAAERLPLWIVRFLPDVDDHNQAKVRPIMTLPIEITAQEGATGVGRLRQPVVKVSGDDGRTWHSANVVPGGEGRFTAIFAAPRHAGYLSLQATAADSAGNTVDQTVIRAYALR